MAVQDSILQTKQKIAEKYNIDPGKIIHMGGNHFIVVPDRGLEFAVTAKLKPDGNKESFITFDYIVNGCRTSHEFAAQTFGEEFIRGIMDTLLCLDDSIEVKNFELSTAQPDGGNRITIIMNKEWLKQ